MKKIILFACVTMGLSAQAQYFDHDYGTVLLEEPQSGMNTTLNHEGFVISGLTTNTSTAATGTFVAYVDRNGNIPGSSTFFAKGYRIKTPPPTSINMNSRDGRVLELSSNNFGIAGTASVSSGGVRYEYIYYIETDTNGAVVGSPVLYNATGCSTYKLNGMAPGSGSTVYLTGYAVESSTGEQQTFVLKINYNGSLVWSHTYDIDATVASADAGNDILENAADTSLYVVGKTNYNGSDDGTMMRLNPATGVPLWEDLYGNTTSAESFSTIVKSNDASFNYGYILGGSTDAGGNTDGWLLRLAGNLSTSWSDMYDYNSSSVTNYFSDVLERVDSMGNYQIYAGGTTASGLGGSADMEVDKVSASGASISQYTYGDANGESLVSIDKNEAGSVPGLSMFGYRSAGLLGSSDLTIYKSYFNGVTQCDYYIDTITEASGPAFLTYYYPDTVHTFTSYSTIVTVGAGQNKTWCSANSVSGGSNRMIASRPASQPELNIYNAEEQNNYLVVIGKAAQGNARITVTDMYGRVLYAKDAAVQQGDNRIPVNLNGAGLSQGVYIIQATQGSTSQSKKICIIK